MKNISELEENDYILDVSGNENNIVQVREVIHGDRVLTVDNEYIISEEIEQIRLCDLDLGMLGNEDQNIIDATKVYNPEIKTYDQLQREVRKNIKMEMSKPVLKNNDASSND